MPEASDITEAKATLNDVASMLEEMRSHLSTLSEDQALWVPAGEDAWPIQRSVAHCVNCEHRAATELERAVRGESTPETIAADTAIFAWFAPTPYALARQVADLKSQIDKLRETLDASHLAVTAVRYPKHPSRRLIDYVNVMRQHTQSHLSAIKKKVAGLPAATQCEPEVQEAYPDFGRSGAERTQPRNPGHA